MSNWLSVGRVRQLGVRNTLVSQISPMAKMAMRRYSKNIGERSPGGQFYNQIRFNAGGIQQVNTADQYSRSIQQVNTAGQRTQNGLQTVTLISS